MAQHSGAIGPMSDMGALPRFAAAGIYANLNSLKTKLNSLAMPVTHVSVNDPEVAFGAPNPIQQLTLDTSDLRVSQIGCFYLGKPIEVERDQDKVTIQVPELLPPGRTRINCTAPSKRHPGRYYWYSQPWFKPTEQGRWLE